MKTIWVTLYALSSGIRKGVAEPRGQYWKIRGDHAFYTLGKDAFETEAEAIADAGKRRDKKIASLKKQLAKLESLTFSAQGEGREMATRTSGWQPIETAPKDGTWFLICRAGEEDFFEVGRYRPFFMPEFVEVEDGIYRKELKAVFDWDGFNNIHRATHWMPIPPAPQGEG